MGRIRTALVLVAACLLVGTGGCRSAGEMLGLVEDRSPRDRYAESIREAGLAGTALGRDWFAAGERALREPAAVETPYREEGYLSPERPAAVAWRVEVPRGRRLVAEVRIDAGRPLRLFLDLFALEQGEDSVRFHHVTSADSGEARLAAEADRDRRYVLRLQPELLRGGRYHLLLHQEATLAFPVSGVGVEAIRSGFGAPREAGRRSHEGVDIFAPRGAPAVAAAPGRVRAETNRLGGQVIWLRDRNGLQTLYYAHLEGRTVDDGDRVARGDTVGRVGNTGNARTTPPHLHFAIYRRGEGPVDPFPFIHAPPGEAPAPGDGGELLGRLARTTMRANLRAGPRTEARRLRTVDRHTALVPRALTDGWFRAMLPDGSRAYVFGGLVEPAESAVGTVTLEGPADLRSEPAEGSVAVARLDAGASIALLGRFGDHRLVRTPAGLRGWVDRPGARTSAAARGLHPVLAIAPAGRISSSCVERDRTPVRSGGSRP